MGKALAVSISILLLVSTAARGMEIHSALCLHGCPLGSPPSNDLVIRNNYILSNNDLTKLADWVSYKVTRDTIGPTQRRSWKADPWLAENETLEPNDYTGANAALDTERGHQAPLASFTGTDTWRETNYLSNITPQQGDLNGGAWRVLEGAVRSLAQSPGVDCPAPL
jgi:endonuclease G, mitochondrial